MFLLLLFTKLRVKLSTADPLMSTIYNNSVRIVSITNMLPVTIFQMESNTDIKVPIFSRIKFCMLVILNNSIYKKRDVKHN